MQQEGLPRPTYAAGERGPLHRPYVLTDSLHPSLCPLDGCQSALPALKGREVSLQAIMLKQAAILGVTWTNGADNRSINCDTGTLDSLQNSTHA